MMNTRASAAHHELPYLPKMNSANQLTPEGGSAWGRLDGGPAALRRLAASLLVTGADLDSARIKSVPSPWARALLFEHALFDSRHPAHTQVLNEWRGVLGAVALQNYLPYVVTVDRVQLRPERDDIFSDLLELVPSQRLDAWKKVGILRINGVAIGATSPLTLMFTGFRAVDTIAIPFKKAGRLIDPLAYLTEIGDQTGRSLLAGWIIEFRKAISEAAGHFDNLTDNSGFAGDSTRSTEILKLIDRWIEAADATHGVGNVELLESPFASAFPDTGGEVYRLIRPAKAPPTTEIKSDLFVFGNASIQVIPDANSTVVGKDGSAFDGQLWVSAGYVETVVDGKVTVPESAITADRKVGGVHEMFEDALIPLTDVQSSHLATLNIDGKKFLLPFKSKLLEMGILAQDLASYTTGEIDPSGRHVVHFTVPVGRGLSVRWTKRFGMDSVLNQANTPSLAVWPDFEYAEWKHHYFIVAHKAAANRIELSPWPSSGVSDWDSRKSINWGASSTPLAVWIGSVGTTRGILVKRPLPAKGATTDEWQVAIDFGSTHTRIFCKNTQGITSAVAIKPRSVVLLGGGAYLPYDFLPGNDEDVGDQRELRTLLRYPDGITPYDQARAWLPNAGVIFWKPLSGAERIEGLQPRLKWHERAEDFAAFHSYASQLFISVLAEASAASARVSSVRTAYPSVFPRYLRNRHEDEWKKLGSRFNVLSVDAWSESDAVAAHLAANSGGAPASNLLAIDIGGSTADFAVWARNDLVYSDSVRMAGDVLSRLVATDDEARTTIADVAKNALGMSSFEWHERAELNGLVFNTLLRRVARENQGSTAVFARAICKGPESPGARIIAHAAYLYAAVSFLLGVMVRTKSLPDQSYTLFFAGRGSQFLPWLDELSDRASTEIPESFFLAGRDNRQASVQIVLPGSYVKEEVGRGLLSPPPGNDAAVPRERLTIMGENGFAMRNGSHSTWDMPLTVATLRELEQADATIRPENLTVINRFLATFDETKSGQAVMRGLRASNLDLDTSALSRIVNKLFGAQSAWYQANSSNPEQAGDALVQPFFVEEAKVVLEALTNNPRLFS